MFDQIPERPSVTLSTILFAVCVTVHASKHKVSRIGSNHKVQTVKEFYRKNYRFYWLHNASCDFVSDA